MNNGKIRLIVTADDFGAGSGRNAGIVTAWRDGIVTGTSLLANGPAFAEAAELAQQLKIPIGVHLNLADYAPVCGPVHGLTGADGAFPGKERSRAILADGDFDAGALRRELAAQIEKVYAADLVPTWLDSHQHAFLFPAVAMVASELAVDCGITAMRLPWPAEPAQSDPSGVLGEELALYRQLAPAAAAAIRAAGLCAPDGLYGMPLLGRLEETALCRLLGQLESGTWELMTHPGYADGGDSFGGHAREIEVAALTAPAVRACIRQRGIDLITYREL